MRVAVSAGMWLAVLSALFCVGSAVFSWRASQLVRKLRSTIYLQGELAEIRDYRGKMDRWAKRINAREVMNEHRDAATGLRKSSSMPVTSDKDELRRRAGLIAGHPARHNGANE